MVRTKADMAGFKAVGAKAARKAGPATPHSTSSNSSKSDTKGNGGGNSYQPRETPGWQKPITSFFGNSQTKSNQVEPSESNSSSTQEPISETA